MELVKKHAKKLQMLGIVVAVAVVVIYGYQFLSSRLNLTANNLPDDQLTPVYTVNLQKTEYRITVAPVVSESQKLAAFDKISFILPSRWQKLASSTQNEVNLGEGIRTYATLRLKSGDKVIEERMQKYRDDKYQIVEQDVTINSKIYQRYAIGGDCSDIQECPATYIEWVTSLPANDFIVISQTADSYEENDAIPQIIATITLR